MATSGFEMLRQNANVGRVRLVPSAISYGPTGRESMTTRGFRPSVETVLCDSRTAQQDMSWTSVQMTSSQRRPTTRLRDVDLHTCE